MQGVDKPRMRPAEVPIVDLDDGRGPRSLDEIYREADEDLAASADLEACVVGKPQGDAE